MRKAKNMSEILDLDDIRENINAIDNEIIKLYEKRLSLCDKVAQYKKSTGKAVLDRERENNVLKRLCDMSLPENREAVRGLYTRIFDISRSRQASLIATETPLTEEITQAEKKNGIFPKSASVACQGTCGAYSEIACNTLFENPSTLFFENFESVFSAVSNGLCEYGILPFENSIYGSVSEVYEMLSRFEGFVVRSVKLPIHHALLAPGGTKLCDIKEVLSHKQAIGQCSAFLSKNTGIKVTPCENTAVAAKTVAESGRRDIAAICSPTCAAKYGLSVLERDLQNSSVNYTMFYCISKKLEIFPDVTKVAFMFNIKNEAGSLESVLSRFAVSGINLTKIESRPIPGKDFEFMFYAEADTNGLPEETLKLFSCLETELDFFKFIGAYTEICAE